VAARGFNHVSLFPGSYDDAALVERVDAAGGADLVFASRTLHHASRPAQAVQSFARLLKKGGHLVVLDYLPHDDDRMREEQGDVWLGFPRKELAAQMIAAGFEILGEVEIPAAFHREGPDAHLEWFAIAARRPAGPALLLTPRLQPEPFHQE
jgi:ArsR family transcriptional regulator